MTDYIYVPIRCHYDYLNAPEQHNKVAGILHPSHAFSSIFNYESFEKIRHFAGIIKNDLEIADSLLE